MLSRIVQHACNPGVKVYTLLHRGGNIMDMFKRKVQESFMVRSILMVDEEHTINIQENSSVKFH